MAPSKRNTQRITVFLPEKPFNSLQKEAEEKGISASALIRMILLERESKKSE